MKVVASKGTNPHIEFCCEGAKGAWDADAIVIVPEPYADNDPIVFTAAIDYEGGSALRIRFCPFCGVGVTRSEPVPQNKTAS